MNNIIQTIKSTLKGREFRSRISHSWKTSWPMILIMLFEFLISLTDVYIAGILGKEIQASIGFVAQMYFIFIVIANALTVGTVTVTSQVKPDQKSNLNTAASTSLVSAVTAGLFLGIAGVIFTPIVIPFINVPEKIQNLAPPLLMVYAVGLMFHYVLITTNGLLRARKMIKRSLLTMGVICVTNIGLNFLLVFYTSAGYLGIALSTVISIVIGAAINIGHIKGTLLSGIRFSKQYLLRIAAIGWPSGLLQVGWQVGSVVLFVILGSLPHHSVEVIAAFTMGLRIEAAIFLPAFAFNLANAVIVGNFIGEDRHDEAYKNGLSTAVTGVTIIIVITALVMLNARRIAPLLSDNPIVIDEAVRYIYISMISEPFMAWGVILGGGLNGAGDTRSVMKIIILSLWIVRLPLSYATGIALGLGPVAIWWSMNISQVVQCCFITHRYLGKKWLYNET